MDQFLTSLSKRQTMMLLTAITFGGQEGVGALEHLPEDEGEMLQHRAQEILQIPRDKRIPLLVQEIKRLMKDRRGQLWSADPERLAALLKRERLALVEVVLRALPAPLADSVRSHLPSTGRVKLTREVRPQVLDIVRWKLEELLARESSAHVPFKFTDVLLLQTRELLTVCDRLGARVLGPAMASLPDAEREPAVGSLPPHLRQLATRAVTANAARKMAEEDAKAQLEQYGGLQSLAAAIRGAGVHRLARASVAQSPEFAARLLEKHRGDFGQILAKWVRDERAKPTSRGDGGRTDIVTDLERLAARGLIERPVRLTPARPPALGPPPPSVKPAPAAQPRGPSMSREMRAGASSEPSSVRRSASSQSVVGVRRDPIAEREARRAGASPRSYVGRPEDADNSRVSRVSTRNSRENPPVAPDPTGARIGPAPSRGTRSRVDERLGEDSEVSRVFRSPVARTHSRSAVPRDNPEVEPDRPPRVLGTSTSLPAVQPEGTRVQRRSRSGVQPATTGRGPRGGTR
ncbi:hypothetical protein [Archangium violaceum]|uniref:hypothetical protein n=1 Tax=Archangium violaceum TaxID=83451 RepID=UPI001EF668A2|nr:hypothetical protein [Archangium violaceum]